MYKKWFTPLHWPDQFWAYRWYIKYLGASCTLRAFICYFNCWKRSI